MGSYYEIQNKQRLDACPTGVEHSAWRQFRDKYHRAEALKEVGHPVQIDIELNGGCNMSCPFCIHGYTDRPNVLMSFDDYKATIDEAIALGVRSAKLSYINEPMMRKDLEQFIGYARQAGMLNVYITTNGTMLSSKRRRSMLQSGITKIFVSIDASTPETYDRQRLSGRFGLVVKNVMALVAERDAAGLEYPLVRVSFLRNSLNEHEEDAFIKFWSGKVDLISIQKMNDLPDADSGITVDRPGTASGCSFPFKQVVVDHEGDILPCCKMGAKKLCVGNIADTTLSDAWQRMQPLRDEHTTGRWRDNPVCNRCITSMGLT